MYIIRSFDAIGVPAATRSFLKGDLRNGNKTDFSE